MSESLKLVLVVLFFKHEHKGYKAKGIQGKAIQYVAIKYLLNSFESFWDNVFVKIDVLFQSLPIGLNKSM